VENEIDLPAPTEPPATDSAAAMIHTPAPSASNVLAVSAEDFTASGNEENQDPNAYVRLGSYQELRDTKEAARLRNVLTSKATRKPLLAW
jgi:hypothetical protein